MAERAKIGSSRGPRPWLPVSCLALALAACLHPDVASAEIVRNPIAVFAALDKITGRISHLEVPINNTVEFGALKVTPRVCDTRPPTEQPRTASFVEVDEVKLTGEVQRIFTGWMFAESPGLHAVEHPVFDVWLTNCKTNAPPAPSGNAENTAAPGAEVPAGEAPPAEAAPAEAAPGEAPPADAPDAAAPPAEAAAPLPWAKPPPNAPSSNR
ncbi:MAG TPA: DUF2155 domain-containing protein [Methyloceanibacter sp.]|nr:DUF2155 domain-containing protein [Methyloceanibacter sp.]